MSGTDSSFAAITSPSAESASMKSTGRLRITARGRAVLALVVVLPLVALVGAFVLNGGSASASGLGKPVPYEHISVASGETLWEVAEEVAPHADPRDVVADFVQLNHLHGADIQAGQSLAVPMKYAAHQR